MMCVILYLGPGACFLELLIATQAAPQRTPSELGSQRSHIELYVVAAVW